MIVHSSSAHCHLQACASALLHALCRRTPLPLNLTLSPACAAPEVHHRVCTSQQVSIHNECGIQILGGAVVERRRNRLIAQGGVPRLSSSDRDFHRGDTLRRAVYGERSPALQLPLRNALLASVISSLHRFHRRTRPRVVGFRGPSVYCLGGGLIKAKYR
jgi:hypothetical protein